MKTIRCLLLVVLAGYLLFGHNPSSWKADISEKTWVELDSLFGQPTFTCSEVGTCKIWVSGYDLFGICLFPSILIVGYGDDNLLTKTKLYLPVYSPTLHRSLGDWINPEGRSVASVRPVTIPQTP